MFSSLQHIHWCVAFCAVNRLAPWVWCNTGGTGDRQLIALAPVVIIHSQISADNRVDSSWPSQRSQHAMKILAQNRDFCLPHLHSTPPLGGFRRNIAMSFGVEKLEWLGYPTVNKFWRYVFVYSFWQNVRTWRTQTQTRTAHDDIGHACIASRGKKICCVTIWDCSDAVLGDWRQFGSVKMCDTIRRPEGPGSYGSAVSSKAAQHGYCWSVWRLHLLCQHHEGGSMSSDTYR